MDAEKTCTLRVEWDKAWWRKAWVPKSPAFFRMPFLFPVPCSLSFVPREFGWEATLRARRVARAWCLFACVCLCLFVCACVHDQTSSLTHEVKSLTHTNKFSSALRGLKQLNKVRLDTLIEAVECAGFAFNDSIPFPIHILVFHSAQALEAYSSSYILTSDKLKSYNEYLTAVTVSKECTQFVIWNDLFILWHISFCLLLQQETTQLMTREQLAEYVVSVLNEYEVLTEPLPAITTPKKMSGLKDEWTKMAQPCFLLAGQGSGCISEWTKCDGIWKERGASRRESYLCEIACLLCPTNLSLAYLESLSAADNKLFLLFVT